jgi:hypothetical protein
MNAELHTLGSRLVGNWTSEARHPQMPGVVISGSSTIEWLDGEKFLIFRSHYDHPDFPDAVSIIGDTDGLHMHYFDSRGVFRLFELTIGDDEWVITMGRQAPGAYASADAPFAQRITFTFEREGREMSGKCQLSHDDVTWDDDLEVIYRRVLSGI